MIGLANLIRQGKVETENFVYYLFTADGTNYALTIEDPLAFSQFFAIKDNSDYDPNVGFRMGFEMNKYFDPGRIGHPKITENSTSNTDDEKAFLDFMHDNNIGATLLESDASLTNFAEVTHDKTTDTIKKQPCN